MIDHVLGRPSVRFRKVQVFAVVSTWMLYLACGNRHGPPGVRRLSNVLSRRLSAWQMLVCTLLALYASRNFGKLVGLECPEPLANLYSPAFFRATWITTALDAGYWSAMHIRRPALRELCSLVFSLYYLVFAEQADEKVRRVRSVVTIEHLRIAWNKQSDSPVLRIGNQLLRPRFTRYRPRAIRIPRPYDSAYADPVSAWLYFDGPVSALKRQSKLILNMHGGGWIAMTPRTHDDSLLAWAGKTGLPVLSIDYRKAPEHPYPYALHECFDVYRSICYTRGRCLGFSGDATLQIVLCGDSAGGNLAAATTLMVLQSGPTADAALQRRRRTLNEDNAAADLPVPDGLVLVYPALDANIGNWMSDEQMALIRDRDMRRTNRPVLRRKDSEYRRMHPSTPLPPASPSSSDDEAAKSTSAARPTSTAVSAAKTTSTAAAAAKPTSTAAAAVLPQSRLAVPSLISYVSDRMLTPEMMRAMILLYIGPRARPDFATDFLLSPVRAPDALLARFPKTHFLTGERDPLVDDTVIMAGRLRAARRAAHAARAELGLLDRAQRRRGFRAADHVAVALVPGVSHGFVQMAPVFPDAWRHIDRVAGWFAELFAAADARGRADALAGRGVAPRRRPSAAESSEDDAPIEIGGGGGAARRAGLAPLAIPPAGGDVDGGGDGEGDGVTARTAPRPGTAGSDGAREHRPFARTRSSVSLASEDDLLGRRMRGLVGGLTRAAGDAGGA